MFVLVRCVFSFILGVLCYQISIIRFKLTQSTVKIKTTPNYELYAREEKENTHHTQSRIMIEKLYIYGYIEQRTKKPSPLLG